MQAVSRASWGVPTGRPVIRTAAADQRGRQGSLADEPTGNLDEGTRDEIIRLLEDLWRARALTLVLVTHDSTIAARAQRADHMSDGRLTLAAASSR